MDKDLYLYVDHFAGKVTKQSIKSKTCMQSALCNNKPAKQAIYIFHHHIHHISSMFILFAPMFHIFATLETPTLLAAVRSSASSVRFTGELPSVETSSGSSAPPLGTGDDSGGVGTCLMLGSGLSLLMTILGWLSMGYVAAFLCGHSIPHNLVISCTNWKRAHDIQSSGKHFHLYLLLISGYWCEIRGYHTTIDDLTWPTWQSAKRATFPARARMCQVKYPIPPNIHKMLPGLGLSLTFRLTQPVDGPVPLKRLYFNRSPMSSSWRISAPVDSLEDSSCDLDCACQGMPKHDFSGLAGRDTAYI